jgi:hypothetical protein
MAQSCTAIRLGRSEARYSLTPCRVAGRRGHSVITRRECYSTVLFGCLITMPRAAEVLATAKVWQIGYLSLQQGV